MKTLSKNCVAASACSTLNKTMLLLLSAAMLAGACKKESENTSPGNGITVSEAGDNDANLKNNATVSATPTGPATIAVYPVRGAHNTGYDAATNCATSSWNCGSTYSNSDYVGGDHYGIDIWGALNTPIAATVTGVVTFKGFDSGLGNTIVIREPSGWHHWLGHMNSLASGTPAVGATIKAGTIVGYLGHTGSNSGSVNHLHMSINHGSGYWSTGQNFWSILKAVEANTCNDALPAGVFDGFQSTGVGRFYSGVAGKGTTVGINLTSSTASWYYGSGGVSDLRLQMIDNTSVTTPWKVRLLSGYGDPANNVSLPKTGKIYFWAITSTAQPGATVRVFLDDSDGTEQSAPISVISGDGIWHKYEWDLSTFSGSQAFPTLPTNGVLDAANVTLDAIVFEQPNTATTCSFYIDNVGK